MSALGLGQNTPPWSFRSLASSSIVELDMGTSDLSEPMGVFEILAIHDVEEGVLDLLGDRPARADADLHAVEFADRRDLGRGAGEEGLVGDVDLVARDALLHHLEPQVLADVQD